jgi:spore germination cell wall hydrolase CwlJ-like protein
LIFNQFIVILTQYIIVKQERPILKFKKAFLFIICFCFSSSAATTYEDAQAQCLAKNIYFEARGEPLVGQIAVGQVTINRARSQLFPSEICNVVYQGKYNLITYQPLFRQCQFRWWCDGRPEKINLKEFQESYRLAIRLLKNDIPDLTEGATYYHNAKVRPFWTQKMVRTVQINEHIFYRKAE